MIALRENLRARKISKEHFEAASETVYPSITPEIVKWYEDFGKKLKSRIIQQSKEDMVV
jgi:SpoVK/Ycf46/Vps4 family AAA+-type ATPase